MRSCMIVSLYRKAMLEIIADIRHNTTEHKLYAFLTEPSQRSNICTVAVQTRMPPDKRNVRTQTEHLPHDEPLHDVSTKVVAQKVDTLDEKIRKFEMKLKEEERKRKQFSNYVTRKEIEEKKKEKYAKKMKYLSPPMSVCSPFFDNIPAARVAPMERPPPSFQPLATLTLPLPLPTNNNYVVQPMTPINEPPPIPSALLAPMPVSQIAEDTIANELQELFGPDDNIDDIFVESTVNNTQIEAIIEEIHNSDVPNTLDEKRMSPMTANPPDEAMAGGQQEMAMENEQTAIIHKRELKDSLWPCELHMQRMRLRAVLDGLADRGMRHNEKIQLRFFVLFGDDSDEDLAAYSPSIELDEILMGSCKKRIAAWIVKYLMRPMTDGLIANRFLFKKLAKHIAQDVIMDNQYPGECVLFVIERVENVAFLGDQIEIVREIDFIL